MRAIHIYKTDNVAVCLENGQKGDVIDSLNVILTEPIPAGHKVALQDIAQDAQIIKYGYPIGTATCSIAKGAWVHTHNVKTNLDDLLEYSYNPGSEPLAPTEPRTFLGYLRADGRVGVRNEIWVIPTVGCVNGVAKHLVRNCEHLVGGSLEKITAFCHPLGCSQCGQDLKNTQMLLSGIVKNPNAGGVLVLGLGCEVNHLDAFKTVLGDVDDSRIRFLNCQSVEDEIAEGSRIIEELAELVKQDKRTEQPVGKLIVGLKCGGSDGFSGITANPVVGNFSDRLIAMGGSTILTEVPEMFGAETILMNRCTTEENFRKTVRLINDFKSYFKKYGETIYDNPSPGNKAGGITTLEDKSLGCTQKGGTAPVCGVLAYGEQVKEQGLNLLSAPGNDLVASTACAAAGAQIVLFTTGRGTPFACPVPTVKIATNPTLAAKKSNWIDFSAAPAAAGTPIAELGSDLMEYVLCLASGRSFTKSEINDYQEIAIFKDGVTE